MNSRKTPIGATLLLAFTVALAAPVMSHAQQNISPGAVSSTSMLMPAGPWKQCQLGLDTAFMCEGPLAHQNQGSYIILITETVHPSTMAFYYQIAYIGDDGTPQTASGTFPRTGIAVGQPQKITLSPTFYLGVNISVMSYSCVELSQVQDKELGH